MIQGEPSQRANFESLYNIKVRNGKEMAPITEFMTITPAYGPDNINRFNMYTSMAVNGNPANGYTSGQAIKAIEEVAQQYLPQGYSYEFSGQTREEQQSSGSTTVLSSYSASCSSTCCCQPSMKVTSFRWPYCFQYPSVWLVRSSSFRLWDH